MADKQKLSGMFRSAVAFTTVAYVAVGWVLASAFGDDIEQSANLNWKVIFCLFCLFCLFFNSEHAN